MAIRGETLSRHYAEQVTRTFEVMEAYRGLDDHLAELDRGVVAQLLEARRNLAAAYLTSLDDDALVAAAKLTGFQGFVRRDPRAAMAHERHVLAAALPRLEADPRFQRRAELVGPGGELIRALADARGLLEPYQRECARFEDLAGFLELLAIGYDTPAFTGSWWQASYWKHWAAGDRICRDLAMNDFGDDVLPAYAQFAGPRDTWRLEVARLEAEIDAVHRLVQERDQTADRLARLPAIYLAQAQEFLGEHLELADPALLEQWAAGDPDRQRAVQVGVRQLAGLQAKRTFLAELRAQGITPLVRQLDDRRQKFQTKASKFARPKHYGAYFDDGFLADGIDAKAPGLLAQRDKLRQRADRLYAADDYAGFDLRNDPELWWIHLVGAPPPRLSPRLHDYYQRHPGVAPLLDADAGDVNDLRGIGDREPSPTATAAAAYMYSSQQDPEASGGIFS